MNPHAAAAQVTLTVTHHDPAGRLADQLRRVLPRIQEIFGGIAVAATHAAAPADLELWRAADALIFQEKPSQSVPVSRVGQTRRLALRAGLRSGADFLLYCDSDRLLHWAEYYPQELAEVAAALPAHDLTVLGRTPRAYDSHPRVQRETELLFNRVFALVSGLDWDIGAAARGLSRPAAQELLAHCPDRRISNDASWLLHLLGCGNLTCAYLLTEGLEYETADRFPQEVQAAGGHTVWMERIDRDPQEWLSRLELAHIEVQAILKYSKKNR